MKKFRFAKAALVAAMMISSSSQILAAEQHSKDNAIPVRPSPSFFVITYAPGPKWKRGEPLTAQGLENHGRFMRKLADDGVLLLAGPLSTSEGGLVILAANSLEEAMAMMANDPAVIEGKFIGEVSKWLPLLDPKQLLGSYEAAADTESPKK